jgi:glutaredoxin-related protein
MKKLNESSESNVLNDQNLRQEMHDLTRYGHIPCVLYVEMALFPDALVITRAIKQGDFKDAIMVSEIFPGLELKIWNQVGWRLQSHHDR